MPKAVLMLREGLYFTISAFRQSYIHDNLREPREDPESHGSGRIFTPGNKSFHLHFIFMSIFFASNKQYFVDRFCITAFHSCWTQTPSRKNAKREVLTSYLYWKIFTSYLLVWSLIRMSGNRSSHTCSFSSVHQFSTS